jgi:glycerol uptake facilitator-like aquaporin
LVREFLGEMLSTFILIVFGCGSVAQFVLGGKNNFNSLFSVNLSWGLAVTMGILVCGKVSGMISTIN